MSDAFEFGQMMKQAADRPDVGGLFGRAGYFDTMKDMYWNKGIGRIPQAIGAWQQKQLEDLPERAHVVDWSKSPETKAQVLYRDFVEKPKQTLHGYGEMARGFASGFHPKVNPVTRFIDQATDPNIGLSGAVGANDPNSAFSRTKKFFGNVAGATEFVSNLNEATKQKDLSPEQQAALAASSAAEKPTTTNYLTDTIKQNPLWLLPAAGLGGIGAYGLYKLLAKRREEKKRRGMRPAAIVY